MALPAGAIQRVEGYAAWRGGGNGGRKGRKDDGLGKGALDGCCWTPPQWPPIAQPSVFPSPFGLEFVRCHAAVHEETPRSRSAP
eukprot:6143144-Pyramimonas_sp.AAC.1